MPQYYEIIFKGHLDQSWSDWLSTLRMTQLTGGRTLLSGPLPDQAALHGLLERIRDLNLILISVIAVEAAAHDGDAVSGAGLIDNETR